MFSRRIVRNFMTSAVRRSHEDFGGYTGSNLPFDINNRWKLTALMVVFLGSGFAAPFILVRHQMLK